MASIIKNQLIKHLSKFTKNLKPEQISLDVMRGHSKLQFVEINEDVLTEILELPCWLQIKRAFCTGVVIKVPWTKLKTCPIELFIDDIVVDVEFINDSSHTPSKQFNKSTLNEMGSYGFINKIIENMSLYINTVEINFDSDMFGGSFMLQRLSVESRSPGWAQVKDLRQTRLTNASSSNSLMFKQVSWHLLRVEASAKSSKSEKRSKINAPLRLITSGGKIRIALKKKHLDGAVIHARIQTVLDDILWVATLPQLRSAISFASYVVSLVQNSSKSFELEQGPINKELSEIQSEPANKPGSLSSAYKVFHFDQTSYHLHVKKIDLHLCDDAHKASEYPPQWDIENGAMQVTIVQLLIDLYPNTSVTTDRSTWMRYPNPSPVVNWLKKNLAEQLSNLKKNNHDKSISTRLDQCWPQMSGFIFVLRVYDLTVQCVSDINTKKDALTNFLESERHLHSIPNDQQVVHIEFALFSHPHSQTLPIPRPAIYSQVGPFSLLYNERTARWLFYVFHSLQSAFEEGKFVTDFKEDVPIPVVKLNMVMLRIILITPVSHTDFRFPTRFVATISRLNISSNIEDLTESCYFLILTKLLQNTSQKLNIPTEKEVPSFFVETSSLWIETDNGMHTKGLPFLNDVSVIGVIMVDNHTSMLSLESKNEMSLIIDHFQFLELVRVTEQLESFFDLLSEDSIHYDSKKSKPVSKLEFSAYLPAVCIYLILEIGEMVSPYSKLNDSRNSNSNMADCSLENLSKAMKNILSSEENFFENSKKVKTEVLLENFPMFPETRTYEVSPTNDDTNSIALSLDDENFEYDDMLLFDNEDLLEIPDIAEEAIVIDEIANNDNVYQCIMAGSINLLLVTLYDIRCQGLVENKKFDVNGNVNQVYTLEKFSIKRNEVNEMLRTPRPIQTGSSCSDVLEFSAVSPSNSKTIILKVDLKNVNLTLDDDIISYLSAFTKDDRTTTNKLRLLINIQSSTVMIVNKKKPRPLRIKIESMVIEQEED